MRVFTGALLGFVNTIGLFHMMRTYAFSAGHQVKFVTRGRAVWMH